MSATSAGGFAQVETGQALSRMYEALRNMRVRDGAGQTDPPGQHSSSTQTYADLAARHRRSEGEQTDLPARTSGGVQTEGLTAATASGAIQTESIAVATASGAVQTESLTAATASAAFQTESLTAATASGAVQIDSADLRAFAMRSNGGQTDAVRTATAGQQLGAGEFTSTADGGAQTEQSHLRGGPSRASQTLDPLLPWLAEEAAVEAAAGSAEKAGTWTRALRVLDTALTDAPTSVSVTLPDLAHVAGARSPTQSGSASLTGALLALASGETDYAPIDFILSASASESGLLVGADTLAARPAAIEGGAARANIAALDLASSISAQTAQPAGVDSPRLFQSAPGAPPLYPPSPRSIAGESAAATSVTAGSAIAPVTAATPAAPLHPAVLPSPGLEPLPARAPSPPTSTQIGAAIALRNLPIASDGGLMDAPHQDAVMAGRVGSSGGMLAFLEAADPTTATALMELVQALQLMTAHSRRRRLISDDSSVVSGTYLHHHYHSPPASPGGSSAAPTSFRGSFITSIGPSVSQAGEASLAGAAVAAAQADAAAAAMSVQPPFKAATPDFQLVLQQAERASVSVSNLTGFPTPTGADAEALDGVPFEQAIGFIMDGLKDFEGGPVHLARSLHMMYAPSSGGGAPASTGSNAPSGAAPWAASPLQAAVALGAASALEAAAVDAGEAVKVDPESPSLTDADRESIQALIAAAVAAADAAARGLMHETAEVSSSCEAVTDEEQSDEPSAPSAPAAEQLPAPSLALTRASSRSNSPARAGLPAASASNGGYLAPAGVGPSMSLLQHQPAQTFGGALELPDHISVMTTAQQQSDAAVFGGEGEEPETEVGGVDQSPSRQHITDGGDLSPRSTAAPSLASAGNSDAQPHIPALTALDHFAAAASQRTSLSKPNSPDQNTLVSYSPRAAASVTASVITGSAWSAPASSSDEDEPDLHVTLARHAMTGHRPGSHSAAGAPQAVTSQPNASDGEMGSTADTPAAPAAPAEQLLAQAAQLLLQAMRLAAQGEPEQEAALHVLSPVLKGLAAADSADWVDRRFGTPLPNSAPITMGGTPGSLDDRQEHSSPGALPAQDDSEPQQKEDATANDATVHASAAAQAAAAALTLPSLLQVESAYGEEQLIPLRSDAGVFSFSQGGGADSAPDTPTAAVPSTSGAGPSFATAADLEAFKEDVMSSVRSALLEVVDMIGTTVVQRVVPGVDMDVAPAEASDSDDDESGTDDESSEAPTEEAGGQEQDFTGSASGSGEQQEIRITRTELEAFMFGKAVLSSTAADDLLGLRLRDLYAPQLLELQGRPGAAAPASSASTSLNPSASGEAGARHHHHHPLRSIVIEELPESERAAAAGEEGGEEHPLPPPLPPPPHTLARPSRGMPGYAGGLMLEEDDGTFSPERSSVDMSFSPRARSEASMPRLRLRPPTLEQGSSLEELEAFLRAFKTRISSDESSEFAREIQRVSQVLSPGTSSFVMTATADFGESAGTSSTEDIARAVAAAAAAVACLPSEAGSGPTISEEEDEGVMKGYNLHTIRASAASALAAAAAVEQVFSPREDAEPVVSTHATATPTPREKGCDSSSGTARTASRLTNSQGGSSSTTPTNPLLKEHLEHFQALLEKANDLVDRLMVAEEEAGSEAGTDAAASPSLAAAAAASPAVATAPSPRNATPRSASGTRRQLHMRLAQVASVGGSPTIAGKRQISKLATASLPSLGGASPPAATTPEPVASPLASPLTSLDPELAALFPATAARLARPDAHVEQSPELTTSLLANAVTAVPQLAAGANRVRSDGSTPHSRSTANSLGGHSSAPSSAGGGGTGSAAAASSTATPLALVAALLAEAHSRMEFRNLEEQRGADKILSAVLDEHFAAVLGTPRGFLTPHREPSWIGAGSAKAPSVVSQPQVSVAHEAGLIAAFNAVAAPPSARSSPPAAAAEASDAMSQTDASLLAPPPQQPQQQPQHRQDRGSSSAAPTAAVCSQPPPTPSQPQQPQQQPVRNELGELLALIMQQRSDLLSSALDTVHRAAGPMPLGTELPRTSGTGGGWEQAGLHHAELLPEPFNRLSISQTGDGSYESLDSQDAASQLRMLPLVLAGLSVPATSVGQHHMSGLDMGGMPQPLMPYQEMDNESQPPSYNVSLAGSARQAGYMHGEAAYSRGPSGRLESPGYSRGPSGRGSGYLSAEASSTFVGQVGGQPSSTVSAGGVAPANAASGVRSSLGGLSVASAPAGVVRASPTSPGSPNSPVPSLPAPAPVVAEAAAPVVGPRAAFDLSYLIDDSDAASSVHHSHASFSHSVLHGLPEAASRGGSVATEAGFGPRPPGYTRSFGGPAADPAADAPSGDGDGDHAPSPPLEQEHSESASLMSYTTGQATYEQRDAELAVFAVALDRSGPQRSLSATPSVGGSSIHEGALRYNPVYDPAEGEEHPADVDADADAFGASTGGAVAAARAFSSAGGSSTGLSSLQYETAYTPLALAAAQTAEPGVLHARLLSAGGTSTAVLDPNPTYESAPRPGPAGGNVLATGRLEPTFSGAEADGGAGTVHPRIHLNFETSIGSAGSAYSRGATKAALPLTPVGGADDGPFAQHGAAAHADAQQGSSSGGGSSLPASEDLPSSLLQPSLTTSDIALLGSAPELPHSRPQSRNSLRRSLAEALPPSQPVSIMQHVQQQQRHAQSQPRPRVSQAGPASGFGSSRPVSPSALAASIAASDEEVTGSVDFDALSREAAALVDNLSTPTRSPRWDVEVDEHTRAEVEAADPLNSTMRLPRGSSLSYGGRGPAVRSATRFASAAGAHVAAVPLEALLPATAAFGETRPAAGFRQVKSSESARFDGGLSPGRASFEAPLGPLAVLSEDGMEERTEPASGSAAKPRSSSVPSARPPKGSLVAAAVRRFESGIPQSPSQEGVEAVAAAGGPKPVFKPASRTASGLPRAPASPGALHGGMSPAGSAGPASRAGSVGSRRESASSLPDEVLQQPMTPQAAMADGEEEQQDAYLRVAADGAEARADTPTAASRTAVVGEEGDDGSFFDTSGSPGISVNYSEDPFGAAAGGAASSSGVGAGSGGGDAFFEAGTPGVSTSSEEAAVEEHEQEAETASEAATPATRGWVPNVEDGGISFDGECSAADPAFAATPKAHEAVAGGYNNRPSSPAFQQAQGAATGAVTVRSSASPARFRGNTTGGGRSPASPAAARSHASNPGESNVRPEAVTLQRQLLSGSASNPASRSGSAPQSPNRARFKAPGAGSGMTASASGAQGQFGVLPLHEAVRAYRNSRRTQM
ncbi:hypothetical protein GPECTOR_9g445 [Gonium pectorale]|uniref:Uncharacterized protein n=1 Tax=Gonium pectorale TaxID=33097 RepID=A0A150GRF8_GONPE|nr:hypothetical protein GPECTOR_9g445 [Gonium pectorale]|eukprot:KXZ52401.1 hypothetical protein GPECTOR_9g445 [Gonium pectorale]